jgi:hypothetical protein
LVQPFRSTGLGDSVQPAAKLLVCARTGKQTTRQRPIVEARTADQDRKPAALVNVADGGRGIARVLRGCVDVGRIGDVDEVMRNTTSRLDRHLVGADVKAAVHGCRIAADDLPVMPLSQ